MYLDFRTARCKDCFKCLRECPVKAIKIENHQAKIIEEKCILCGKCTTVCPQDAKSVHRELEDIKIMLNSKQKVVASIAPAFVSSFSVQDFSIMRQALLQLGFYDVEETSIGANEVTKEYVKLLETKQYKNFITSACPAINRMIQIYYPNALKYLAPVASPMVAHARMLKQKYPDAKIVFLGPCIAKKREAKESNIIDGVLTFEELKEFFEENKIDLTKIEVSEQVCATTGSANKAKYYPISRGIIKSFDYFPQGYEYVAIDGVTRSFEVLEHADELENMFIEINCCESACINGPCSLAKKGLSLKSNQQIRKYVAKDAEIAKNSLDIKVNLEEMHPQIRLNEIEPTEEQILEVLRKTGKLTGEDEINCGACGFSTCREKAIAVIKGHADVEMCIPYMRAKAESMSYEIIQNSPNGIIVLDMDYKIQELNNNARKLLGIMEHDARGLSAFDCFDSKEFLAAILEGRNIRKKKAFISKTHKYVELNIVILKEHKVLFGVFKDITETEEFEKQMNQLKKETLQTTDEVIKKQMRVAQEIASLLGETTAETKVALLKLKKTLQEEEK